MAAQPAAPVLVANINQEANPRGNAIPEGYFPLEHGTIFTRKGTSGRLELWRTDGTGPGTFRLGGDCSAACVTSPVILGFSSSRAYFLAPNDELVQDLWVSDGTTTGTRRLTFLSPPARISNQRGSWLLDGGSGRLYFALDDGRQGEELWVSNGTASGTRPVRDIEPGPEGSFPRFSIPGVVLGSLAFFDASDSIGGRELWATDGTPGGTRRVADIDPGPGSSNPTGFGVAGDRLVFFARDPDRGSEPWSTDGTTPGTMRIGDLNPGPEGSRLESLVWSLGNKVVFFVKAEGGSELWASDGTAAGTLLLASYSIAQGSLTGEVFEDRLLFAAEEEAVGRELWVSDGTPSGTRLLKDVCPGACSSSLSFSHHPAAEVAFTADDGVHGDELWLSDGTAAGTRPVADLCPGDCSSNAFPLLGIGADLYFLADDGTSGIEMWRTRGAPGTTVRLTDFVSSRPFSNRRLAGRVADRLLFHGIDIENGLALWSSNGTPSGTRPFVTLAPAGDAGSNPTGLTVIGDRVYFAALDGKGGQGLWRSDGTPGGTGLIRTVLSGAGIGGTPDLESMIRAGDRLFFFDASSSETLDLWTSDGTADGTLRVIAEAERGSQVARELFALGNRALFFTLVNQPGLWSSDGTQVGTRRLRELAAGPDLSTAALRGELYFFADLPGASGRTALWKSDGTPGGTLPVVDLGAVNEIDPRELTVAGDRLYFTAQVGHRRLWTSDGTAAGTGPVEPSASFPGEVADLTPVEDQVFFFGLDEQGERALWVSDGAAAGTRRLGGVRLRESRSRPPQRAALGSRLFFIAEEPAQPPRLWVSDGTPDGTRPFDLLPAPLQPEGVWAAAERVLVAGINDDVLPLATQLWTSDATGGGAALLRSFAGRGMPEEIGEFNESGDRVLFRATDETFGTELWAFDTRAGMPPSDPPAAPTRLEAEPVSPFSVRLTWHDNTGGEADYLVERSSPLHSPLLIAALPAGAESYVVDNLEPGLPYTFRVRATGGGGTSAWSNAASATPFDPSTGPCSPGPETLCLRDGRFRVRVRWKDQFNGGNGSGRALPFDFSDDSGTFWFFDPANVELVVKVLNGTGVNGFLWVFYGALSNVEYWITVTDTRDAGNRTYHNPPGELCGLGDVRAFPRPPASIRSAPANLSRSAPESVADQVADEPAPDCTAGTENLCLNGGRFRVEVSWTDPRSGDSGVGHAVTGSDDSGYFWFFDAENVELVVKVLDGRAVNGRFWVFYGALSDVEYEITVTDTRNDESRLYRNEPRNICGQADTLAF